MTQKKYWQPKNTLLMASLLATVSLPAHAVQFSMGDVNGTFSSKLSIGASWRMDGQDKTLLSPGNTNDKGRASSSVTDDGNLNFEDGDLISFVFKGRHDLELTYQNLGLFTRFRYWYDQELENGKRPHGNSLNEYTPDKTLDDSGFSDLAKSSGIELLDLYVYGSFDLGNVPLDLRLGRQVVSWGESTFIQNGVNIINPVDVSALRKPGAELKEALLPVGMLYMGAGLTDALSMEAFYQYEWKKTELDGCGTYFATNDVISDGCEILTVFSTIPDQIQATEEGSFGPFPVPEQFLRRADDLEASDSGQYGLSFRYFAESLNSTEFGIYYLNYHSRTPIFSAVTSSDPFTLAPLLGGNPQYRAEFPEDIKLLGLSFSTNVGTWAVSGEISTRPDLPLQINTTHILHAVAVGGGLAPWSDVLDRADAAGEGGNVAGYDEKEFTQIQFTFLKFFDQVMGASRMTFVGEIGANHIGGLGSKSDANYVHYGRSPTYGIGSFQLEDGKTCEESGTFPANTNIANCTKEGYITSDAWGYRMLLAFDYSNAFAGVNLKPRIGWSHDVRGYAPAPNFNEGNKALSLALDADYLNTYTASISYTQYTGGDYNTINDRDFASISFGVSF